MYDSDDNYFSDDLVLDDKTLAVLDEEESKFKRANIQAQQSTTPPAKRQKTAGSWQPHRPAGRANHRTDTLDDMEDLPDVSIRQDGTYGLRDKHQRPHTSRSTAAVQAAPGIRPTTAAPLSRGSVPPTRRTSAMVPVRASQVPSRPPSSARGTRIVQSPIPSQDVSRAQPGPSQQIHRNVSSVAISNAHVQQLRQQIEELRKTNEAVCAEMESAREAKFVKEGEVTILRKRLEKIAQEHLAHIAKLKLAKDEADAKRVLLQKQYEAEKERLKTELTFKRHELETSWKHAVPRSPMNDISLTAGPLPSQRQRSAQSGSAGPSRLAPETPCRPRFGVILDFDKPKKPAAVDIRDLPSGFQIDPLRSQSVVSRKGKETVSFNAPLSFPSLPNAGPIPQGLRTGLCQADVFGTQLYDAGPVEPAEGFVLHADVGVHDVQMMDEGIPVVTFSSQGDTTVLAPPSSTSILHGIVVTHTLRGSKLPTLQSLICVCPTDTDEAQSYGAALMQIFDTLGGIPIHPDSEFDHLARIVCRALCEITRLLAKNNLIPPLTAALNLLTNLAYMLPSIHAFLTLWCTPGHDETPQLLPVLHHIIQDRLQGLDVTAGDVSPDLCSLGRETLSLYEALVWWMPDDFEGSLGACPGMSSLLMTLLHPHRPLWFLIGGMRILLWLSTRRSLFRSLLSHPGGERQVSDANTESGDLNHPQIGAACSLLTDTSRQGPEADELKSYIIMFFGIVSNAHPDAYTLLVESQELIPSIVLHLCHQVALIWDEHGEVLSDPQAITRTVGIINHATLLLHHLVIGEDATLDLRERLLHTPAKTYRGLVHSFILTFGRLSYANPPYWLEVKNKKRLAGVADLARALLERVIQGPELDLMWGTYQDEREENNDANMDVDEEEAEAQKIAIS